MAGFITAPRLLRTSGTWQRGRTNTEVVADTGEPLSAFAGPHLAAQLSCSFAALVSKSQLQLRQLRRSLFFCSFLFVLLSDSVSHFSLMWSTPQMTGEVLNIEPYCQWLAASGHTQASPLLSAKSSNKILVLCGLKKSSIREREVESENKTDEKRVFATSYHSCTKLTSALIIDTVALSKHFIVCYVS